MKNRTTTCVACIAMALASCTEVSEAPSDVVGAGLIGAAAAGIVAATVLDASAGWVIVAAAAGAAAGVLIARNARTNECAYADGEGGYTVGSC